MMSQSRGVWLMRRVLLPTFLTTLLLANLILLIPASHTTILPLISDGKERLATVSEVRGTPAGPVVGQEATSINTSIIEGHNITETLVDRPSPVKSSSPPPQLPVAIKAPPQSPLAIKSPPQPPLAVKALPPSPPPPTQAIKSPPPPTQAIKSPPPPTQAIKSPPPPTQAIKSPPPPTQAIKSPPPPTQAIKSPPPPTQAIKSSPPPPPPPPQLTTTNWDQTEEFFQTERRIAERVARLRDQCTKMSKPSKVKTNALDVSLASRTQVLEEHRLLACQVYKAGSTAWNSLLARRYNQTNVLSKKKDYYRMLMYLNPTVKRFREVATSSKFQRFLVVRNPLERLLSAYRDRIWDRATVSWQAHHYVPLILRHTRGRSYSHQEMFFINGSVSLVPTFTEFVRFLVEQPTQEYDPHWMPISLLCGVCYINYTAVVHIETFLPDMKYIMRVSELDRAVDPSLLTLNSHKGRGNTRDLLASHYSKLGPQILQLIVNVYKADFSLFGYDPTDFLEQISPNVTIKWRD